MGWTRITWAQGALAKQATTELSWCMRLCGDPTGPMRSRNASRYGARNPNESPSEADFWVPRIRFLKSPCHPPAGLRPALGGRPSPGGESLGRKGPQGAHASVLGAVLGQSAQGLWGAPYFASAPRGTSAPGTVVRSGGSGLCLSPRHHNQRFLQRDQPAGLDSEQFGTGSARETGDHGAIVLHVALCRPDRADAQ